MAAPTYPVLSSANLPFGSEVLTIDSVTYIAENFNVTQSSVTAERQDEEGAPNGFALNVGPRSGTAQLQLATTSTAIPVVGHTFTRNTIVYVITEVGEQQSQSGFKVLPISFREQI